MRSRLFLPALAALLWACASDPSNSDPAPSGGDTLPAARPTPPSGSDAGADLACAATQITGDSVGPLRIGLTVDAVRQRCRVVRDMTVEGAEGMPTRLIAVLLGRDTVDAEIVEDRVWRIPVTSPRLQTADGIGVGTPLARLLEVPDVRPAMGEGMYVLTPAHCGLSFQLENPDGPLPPATTVAQLRALPAGVRVSRILVTGCSG